MYINMENMRYKILCLFYDEEPQFLAQDPEEELAGHEVTVVHTYLEAKVLLLAPGSCFDIFLADMMAPYSQEHMDEQGPTFALGGYMNTSLKGFGTFVPEYFTESGFSGPIKGNCVFVADKHCWTPTGQRDWQKMFRLTERLIGEFAS